MKFRAIPIRYWLPLSVLLAFGGLLGGLSWLHLADFRAHALENAQTRLGVQGRMLQHHLEDEIRVGGLADVQDDFSVLSRIPEVTGAALINAEGMILAGSRIEWRGAPATRLPRFDPADFQRARQTNQSAWHRQDGDRSLTYYLPVGLHSNTQLRPQVGILFVSYDNSHILRQAQWHAFQRFLWILGAGLVILATLILLLRRRLLKPLAGLGEALHHFGQGSYHIRLEEPADQDLALLARHFNDMAGHQQHLLAALSQSQRNLAATLDSIGDAVIVTDAEGRITRMNGVAESLTGWSLEEARGQAIEKVMLLVDNVRRDTVPMPVRQALSLGEVVQLANHTKLLRRDGSEIHIADSAAPIREADGRITGVVMVCRDVNREYALREALREQEAIYRLMAEQTASFDYWLEPGGGYRYLAPACERITGYSVEDFRRTPDFLESITHPDDREMVRRHGLDVSHPGLPQHAMEFRILHRSGEVRWLHHLCQDIFGEDGAWLGRRAANLDITARKAAEEALARQASDLQSLVDERTEQLQRSNAALAQASRSKDEFLAAMSHELRTPLTAILGLTELLRDAGTGPLTPKQHRHVRQIEDSGRHLLELINDILDLAKIEAGQFALQAEVVSVPKVVEASLAMVREAARAKDLRLSLAEDGRVARLRGDSRRIRQALVNLLSNAVKFTPAGGQVGLEVLGDDEHHMARFTVWDTGIGISSANQARLFHPFTQVDSRLSREYTGTGLGLVLVKHMAELHQGRVEVDSEPDRGSRFTLVLPWNPDETLDASRPGVTAGVPTLQATGRRVLLVDDNEVNREMAREVLEINGHVVTTAGNGEEALALLAGAPLPDVVLLDIQMPVMDGPSTLAHLRGDPHTAHLPVVALTALAMSGDRDRLLEQGFDAYLAKPYQFDALERAVRDTTRRGMA